MLTPADLVHLHLLLNHFPTVGMIVGFGIFLAALTKKSDEMKRGALAVLFAIALLSLPAYMTGYSAAKAVRKIPEVSQSLVDLHQRSALLALVFMESLGVVAWFGLWQSRPSRAANPRRVGRSSSKGITAAVLVLSVLTLAWMTGAANIGGGIRHPEILDAPVDLGSANSAVFAPSWLSSEYITKYQYRHAWAWKTLETIHFMGLCLLFGVVLVGNLRLLGWMETAPLEGFYRLLPYGVLGFAANAVTGMMFFIGQAFQYIENPAFHLKMLCILLAAGDVLYLTWHDEVWEMGPGQTPPAMVKVLAASQICLWVGVIYFGRMLPYIGDAF